LTRATTVNNQFVELLYIKDTYMSESKIHLFSSVKRKITEILQNCALFTELILVFQKKSIEREHSLHMVDMVM